MLTPTRGDVLRRIAGHEIDKILPDLSPEVRGEYATAVVRQWVTCAGHAAILTEHANYWLALESMDGQYHVGAGESETSIGRFVDDWRIPDDQIPELLHRLTVAQSATCESEDGLRLRLRVVPHERTVAIEQVEDE